MAVPGSNVEERRGLPRVTKQRRAIFSVLQGNPSHPTAEEIYRKVKRRLPQISLATVYRNLKVLVREGLISEITIPDGPNRYDFRTQEHHHFICDRCERVYDVEVPVQDRLTRELSRQGYLVRARQTVFYGLCPKCETNSGP